MNGTAKKESAAAMRVRSENDQLLESFKKFLASEIKVILPFVRSYIVRRAQDPEFRNAVIRELDNIVDIPILPDRRVLRKLYDGLLDRLIDRLEERE